MPAVPTALLFSYASAHAHPYASAVVSRTRIGLRQAHLPPHSPQRCRLAACTWAREGVQARRETKGETPTVNNSIKIVRY